MFRTNKKILIVTPSLPFPITGAEQSDRANGIKQLIRLGFEVRVIVKLVAWQSISYVKKIEKELGIKFFPIAYKYSNRKFTLLEKIKKILLKLSNPLFLDGAALEYSEPEIKRIFEEQIKKWKPSLVWFDYTYLWPLYNIAQKRDIPIITRSVNLEPIHFLQEDGYSILNFIKFLPKFLSEIITIKKSNFIFAISPKEEEVYRKLGAKNVNVLPLRGLNLCLKENREIKEKKILNVFFMGSTYNVYHNKKALEFILKKIVLKINELESNKFRFYIFGAKMPREFHDYLNRNIIYKGYVDDLELALSQMDIALIPSLLGAGMQQKIFEPLARGFPTITSERGIAGYPFKDNKHLLFAWHADEFVNCLIRLKDINLRRKLSKNALELSNQLFSQKKLDKIITENFYE